ncbi:hypothetical protein FRX31_008027 [Thalictrum thalictroides]|uniref:Transmembrane protein n=1 Tax=Thalictrum thalictroides TaxID=46969 RepID=A0A7J6WY86_THATH|nr:hypothetical protein FRX31_008027 [Thalictrum thalictroides]
MNGSKSTQKLDEEKQEEKMGLGTTLMIVGAAIGAGLLAWGALVASSNEDEKKMMKAPGRNGEYIGRKDFEDNPREYFRDLHGKK